MHGDASTQAGFAREAVAATLDSVLVAMRNCPETRRAPLLIGLSGLQGSGKSTFARQLSAAAKARSVPTEVLSLDDFYLGRRERARLASAVHPLLMTRGVPGTHDVGLLERTIDALAGASGQHPVHIPRFDKGRDTRLPRSRWRRVANPPRLTVLEGWCVGVPPQSPCALLHAVNALEREEDANGDWRRWVNAQLTTTYARLWRRLDLLLLLEAPGFAIVAQWRDEQERALRDRHAPHAMSASALSRFLLHYERLSRHAIGELPALADLRIVLDCDRAILEIARG